MNDPVRDESGRELAPPQTICGHTTSSRNGASNKVCNQPPGHEGDHGVSETPGGTLYVRWPRG
jgi:hypothetical protein